MYFFAMDLGWNRVPILLILLIFWKHAVGQKGWTSQDFHPRRKGPVWKVLSPRGAQSSVLEAPVTGSIPFEEVASDVLAGKNLDASRSQFSFSDQNGKGGVSSSNEYMSHTQSAPSASVSASMILPQNQQSSNSITSLLQLQGSFSPSVQDIANQTGSQLVETSSPLSAQSSSSAGSSDNSFSKFTYTSQGSSRPQKAGSSSQLVSTHGVSGLLLQSLPSSTASQNIPGSSAYTILAASPLGVSQSTSGQNSYSWYTSGSQSRAGTQLSASRQYVPTSFQPEVATSQYGSKFSLGSTVPVSSQYYPATQSGSSPSQGLQASSTVASQGFQTSGASQSASQSRSRLFSLSSPSTLQLQGISSQYAPAALDSKVPVYSQAPPSGASSSLSQPSQLKPSTSRWSQGLQTFGTVTQSSYPSQGSKAPSRFSTLTSASPGQFASTQTGTTFTDGSSLLLQGTSSQYTPASLLAKVPVYNQAPPSGSSLSLSQPSQLKPSTSRWSQGFQASGTVASQGFQTFGTATSSQSSSLSQGSKAPSRFSTLTSASPGQFASTQTGTTSTDGSSLLLQGTSSQYAPAALDSKVPVYSQAAPSGSSSSLSQPSQLKPSTSRWSQGFQASGTVASQGFQTFGTATSHSSSLSQGLKAPSRFSTLMSAASPGQFAASQEGSGRYSGLSSQSQSASSQYRPGSPAYAKHGSSLQLQGTSSQYTPAALVAKVPVYNQAPSGSSLSLSQPSQLKPSTSRWSQGFQASGTVASQGFQTFGTATSQSSSSQGSKAPSRFSTLTSAASPGQFAASQEGSGRYSGLSSQSQSASSQYRPGSPAYAKHGSSLQLQGTSSQYTPAALVAKVPVYSQAPPSGSIFSLSQPSQLKPSTSSWSQGFQASGTATSQSSSSQGFKAPSRFSTLTSAASPGQFAPTQGSGRYSGFSRQSQSASSQYRPGSPAYVKYGSSLLAVSSQSTSDQSASDSYASSSQSRTGTQLAGSSPYVPMQTGNASTDGSSLQLQGTSSLYAPAVVAKVPVYSQVTPSGSLLSQLPSASSWSQGFQASGTAGSQSSSSPQTPQFSSAVMPALSPPVDSVAQSSQSFSSVVHSQMSPGMFASVQHPTDSVTSSLGSNVQAASQGMFSGQSSDSTSVVSSRYASTYDQKPLSYSRPSQSSSASRRYSSSVKG